MNEHAAEQNDQTRVWLEACLGLSRRKIAALMRNDLSGLEQCVDEEGRLLALRPTLKASSIPQFILDELHSLNKRNGDDLQCAGPQHFVPDLMALRHHRSE